MQKFKDVFNIDHQNGWLQLCKVDVLMSSSFNLTTLAHTGASVFFSGVRLQYKTCYIEIFHWSFNGIFNYIMLDRNCYQNVPYIRTRMGKGLWCLGRLGSFSKIYFGVWHRGWTFALAFVHSLVRHHKTCRLGPSRKPSCQFYNLND
jgi:hypothetical protein